MQSLENITEALERRNNNICGIIYGKSFTDEPVNKHVLKQFQAQRNRGTEGFGLFDTDRGNLARSTKERKIKSYLKNRPSREILFHHRWPTSTDNVKNACHPFSTKDFFATNYVLIHNGHITNSRSLRKAHEELGITYHSVQPDDSFNDSEALLWDVALYLEGKQDRLNAYGGIAFICIAIPKDGRKHTKLHFGRNTNPIKMLYTDKQLFLSSEGAGEMIDSDKLYSYDYRTKVLSMNDLKVPSYDPDWKPVPYSGPTQTGSAMGFHPQPHDWRNVEREWDSSWYNSTLNPDGPNYIPYSEYDDDDELAGISNSDFDDDWPDQYYIILPEDADFSYAALYPEISEELVFENNDGVMINVKQAVVDRVDNALELSDGLYKTAYALIREDIRDYERMNLEDHVKGLKEDEDIVLEIDILRAAKHAVLTSPFWKDDTSRDPKFGPLSRALSEFLSGAQRSQQQLLK